MNNLEQKKCYNCSSKDKLLVHKGVRDNKSIDVYECKNCGLVYLSSDEHINKNFYQDGKMLKNNDIGLWLKSTCDDDFRRFNRYKKLIKNKTVCDFGCGNGGFLSLAKQVTQKVYGVELQQDFYSYFAKNGLKVYPTLAGLPEKADIITMFHVLEHLKDPVQELKTISDNLADNGKIIIEVPSSNDALLNLYKCKSFADFTYWSCHLFLYNKNTITNVVEKAGLKVKKFRYIQRYGFVNHLHWLICKKPAGHKNWKSFDFKFINILYALFLGLFSMTDTLELEVVKNKDA